MSEESSIPPIRAKEKGPDALYLDREKAHARALELFSQFEIKLKRFKGVRGYTDDEIDTDDATAERIKAKFDASLRTDAPESREAKEYADILEAIAFEHGEQSNWFGPHAQVIKTSRYDDYVNGVDLVVETEKEHEGYSHLSLGVDITFSGNLHKKFSDIREEIDRGELRHVKYFMAEREDHVRPDRDSVTFAGKLKNIPHVVVGVEVARLRELGLLWMNRKGRQLGEHPVQRMILQEAMLQLETFATYARAIGKNELAAILERQLEEARGLMKEKREAGIGTIEGDKVFEEIKNNLAMFAVPNISKK